MSIIEYLKRSESGAPKSIHSQKCRDQLLKCLSLTHQALQCTKGLVILIGFIESLKNSFTFTSFFWRDGCLSSSSKLEILAVKIGSATDFSVLRWRIFTFFHFCNNKTSILCKNKAKLRTTLGLTQSLSSTFGSFFAITLAAAITLSRISSAFIPVWPIRAVLKEMNSSIYMWANTHTSSSLGALRCNYLNFHKRWLSIAELSCNSSQNRFTSINFSILGYATSALCY